MGIPRRFRDSIAALTFAGISSRLTETLHSPLSGISVPSLSIKMAARNREALLPREPSKYWLETFCSRSGVPVSRRNQEELTARTLWPDSIVVRYVCSCASPGPRLLSICVLVIVSPDKAKARPEDSRLSDLETLEKWIPRLFP